MEEAQAGDSGWSGFDPADPDLPVDLRQVWETYQPPRVLGEVHVLVHELQPGRSEVRVGGDVDEVTLIDAAIVELQEARRVFGAEDPGEPTQ